MKKTYKPGDEIGMSQFTKKQAAVITNQIKLLEAASTGLDHFSVKLKRSREIMLKIALQSIPALKDYVFHVEHTSRTIRVVIDNRID